MEVFDEAGQRIGVLTSGTYSPLLKAGIGMAYVRVSNSQEGNTVNVKIRDKTAKARIVAFPFYDPEEYGYKRLTVK